MPRERNAQFSWTETFWEYLKRTLISIALEAKDRRLGGFPRDVAALPGSDGYKMLVPEMFDRAPLQRTARQRWKGKDLAFIDQRCALCPLGGLETEITLAAEPFLRRECPDKRCS